LTNTSGRTMALGLN